MPRAFLISALCVVAACGGDGDGESGADAAPGTDSAPTTGWLSAPALPAPIANNAVAAVSAADGCHLFSVLGIAGSFGAADITNAAYRWLEGDAAWQPIADAPGPARVAASAVGLRGNLYVLGGYTVAAGGAEASSDRLDMYNLESGAWETRAPVPTPIDDTVALAWRDRYIVVVSGWSNTANVATVQIYDADGERWTTGTPFPGTPAFGHAGGIDGDTLVLIDGAASTAGFPLVRQTWRADLDAQAPETIAWTDLGAHPGPGRYRAAGGRFSDGQIWFHGGTESPYNFDGLRYDNGAAAIPLATTLVHSSAGNLFELSDAKPRATMDHRSLASCPGDRVYSVGGMVAGPAASAEVWLFAGEGGE